MNAAIAKPRRICIPLEKNFTWRSMAPASWAKSTMSSNRRTTSLRPSPISDP